MMRAQTFESVDGDALADALVERRTILAPEIDAVIAATLSGRR
jgi:hypothetical protein